MTEPRTITEEQFLPGAALEEMARSERKAGKLAANPSKTLIRGGKRVIHVKVKVPIDQYAGLQRFEGATDSDKINALIRMANRRVDAVVAKGPQALDEALQPVQDEGR